MLRKTGTAEPSFGAGDLPNCGGAHAAGGGARRRWLAQAVVHAGGGALNEPSDIDK
jgi:hypothetical protein